MKLYLPKGLDIDLHLKENPPFAGFKKDKILYIIHCIVTIPNHNKGIIIRDGFVPLSSEVLQDVMNDYKKYTTYGVETGLLACDNSYSVGFKSKGYKIILPHESEVEAFTFKDVVLKRKFNTRHLELTSTTKNYAFLNKWFEGPLTMDVEAAQAFLDEEYTLKSVADALMDYKMVYNVHVLNEDGTRGGYEKVLKNPELQLQQGKLSLEKMKNQHYCCHIDPTVHRYHSTLTNMRSVLRNFLLYDNERLVSIDIKNSQPYLICLLLQLDFWKSTKIVRPNLEKPTKNRAKKVKKRPFSSKYNDFNVDLDWKARLPIVDVNDIQLNIDLISIAKEVDYFMLLEIKTIVRDTRFDTYIEQVTSGRLYDYLQESFEQVLGYAIADRKEIKAAVFQVLFTPNTFIGQKQAQPKKMFKTLFPEVYELLNRIKKKDSTLLPRMLQQIESYIMLQVVAKRLKREHPKVPIFTIHDSILTTASNQLLVEKIMQEELLRIVGHAPTLHSELLHPKVADAALQNLRDRAKEMSA